MKKTQTPSYVVTLEADVTPKHLREIEARLEVARVIYNTCLGRLLKRWRGVQGLPEWREGKSRIQAMTRKGKLSSEESAQKTSLVKRMKAIETDFGLTEYGLHAFVKDVNVHFHRRISSNEAQTTATRAWRTFEKYRYGQSRKVRFMPKGAAVTVENKSNSFGLRVVGQELVWKDLRVHLIVKSNDSYAQDTFLDKTKYVRLFTRTIRGCKRVFVQIVKEGTPPSKSRVRGSENAAVGMDIGPSTVAVYSVGCREAFVEPLAPSVDQAKRKIRTLSRCISRSLEKSNPQAKDEQGRWKKGVRLVKSRRCLKLQAKLGEIKRKQAVNRKRDHETLANRILALGADIRVEDTTITSWTKRAKETTVNRKNGKYNRKKRFGKSVGHHAPGMLLSIIDRKLGYGAGVLKRVTSRRVKASQLNHADGSYRKKTLSERWFEVEGQTVQRDLYSAWLIAHVKPNLEEVDLDACRADWPNFLLAQKTALAEAPKGLSIF